MSKTKTREITLTENASGFSFFKKPNAEIEKLDFEDVSVLRRLLSKEKARMLYVLKHENPHSIYDLAKKLERPFKAVFDDLKLLQRMGFVDIVQEKSKKRICHKPILVVDQLTIHFKI